MAISIIQHKSTFLTNVTSVALTFTSPVTAGSLLVYAIGSLTTSVQATTDNNTNSISNGLALSTAQGQFRVDFVTSGNSGSTTVTAHGTGPGNMHLHIWEIGGCATASPFDQKGDVAQTGTALTVTTAGATVQANEIVFGMFFDQFNSYTYTAGAGFSSNPTESTIDVSGSDSMFTEVNIVSATGTQTATCTLSTSDTTHNIVFTFKALAGSVSETLADNMNDGNW